MSFFYQIKKTLLGKSLPNSAHEQERFGNPKAFVLLGSNAISSLAYSTQEILSVLVLAGSSALTWSLPITVAIIVLLTLTVISHAGAFQAYPNRGGAYIIAYENLGLYAGLVAAAALMIDFILTVAVSVSLGTAAISSAFPDVAALRVSFGLILILLLMVLNLRNLSTSSWLFKLIFIIPTSLFIGSIFGLIIIGLYKNVTGQVPHIPSPIILGAEPLSWFLVLRAFSVGSSIFTGIEILPIDISQFKSPEWKNARITLFFLGAILGILFLGLSYLADIYHILPDPTGQTTVSLLARNILGDGKLYYLIQLVTFLTLFPSAYSVFLDFPLLCSLLAHDGFLPRQLTALGDRLVFANGIIALGVFAALLLILFRGQVDALVPLYTIGVFVAITLTHYGMVVHWCKERSPRWRVKAALSGLAAISTTIVLITVLRSKFAAGAWIVVVAIPLVVALFLAIHEHYKYVAERLNIQQIQLRCYIPRPKVTVITHPAIIIIGQLHRGTFEALDYARSIADEIVAIHVDIGLTDREKLQERWQELAGDIPLMILESPYRSVVEPIVNFVHEFEVQHPGVLSTVIIPTFVPRNWWESFLHNQTALFLKNALRAKKSRVITTVRYYV